MRSQPGVWIDRNEYFSIANKSMESFTRGIWSLNLKTKHLYADRDIIDVLDLEGIENEDAIHYLVVVAMVLSKAILICNNQPRFPFSVLKLLKAGVNIFKEYNIQLPKPVLYMQVPFGEKTYELGGELRDAQDSIDYIKDTYKHVQDFDIRFFSLPDFGDNRFDQFYLDNVAKLISELQSIDPGKNMKDRILYAKVVIGALNGSRPQFVSDMNFKMFRNDLRSRIITIKHENEEAMLKHFKSISVNENITFDEFILKGCPNDGLWHIDINLWNTAKSFAYFDPKDSRHIDLINDCIKTMKFVIDPKSWLSVEICYKKVMSVLKGKMNARGDKLLLSYNESYAEYVDAKINEYLDCIKYKPEKPNNERNINMPRAMIYNFNEKKQEYKRDFITKTQNLVDVPKDFLIEVDYNDRWEIQLQSLQAKWRTQKSKAYEYKDLVRTSGDLKCPKCGNDHLDTLIHRQCTNNWENSKWIWIDYPTHMFGCTQCKEEKHITRTTCFKCHAYLNTSIISKSSR